MDTWKFLFLGFYDILGEKQLRRLEGKETSVAESRGLPGKSQFHTPRCPIFPVYLIQMESRVTKGKHYKFQLSAIIRDKLSKWGPKLHVIKCHNQKTMCMARFQCTTQPWTHFGQFIKQYFNYCSTLIICELPLYLHLNRWIFRGDTGDNSLLKP